MTRSADGPSSDVVDGLLAEFPAADPDTVTRVVDKASRAVSMLGVGREQAEPLVQRTAEENLSRLAETGQG